MRLYKLRAGVAPGVCYKWVYFTKIGQGKPLNSEVQEIARILHTSDKAQARDDSGPMTEPRLRC
jgi:hypothetical protein